MRTTSLHMIANINANDCQQKYQQLLLTVFMENMQSCFPILFKSQVD